MQRAILYLIPTTLGDSMLNDVLPQKITQVVEQCKYFIVENEKTARRFIKYICPEKLQSELFIFVLNKHTNPSEFKTFLEPIQQGHSIGLLSEAGCPAVADPGAEIVAIAHQKNIEVYPLVGPSSIVLSVMASGLGGQNFAFNGYLPIEKTERKSVLKKIEKRAREEKQSQIFIETPYRNDKLLEDMVRILQKDTQICVATDLTLSTQFIKTQSVESWKKEKINLNKRPTIFIIG